MARSADPKLRQWWRELIDSFDSTQETVGDFCRRHQVSTASFYGWRRKLARSSAVAAASPRRKRHARCDGPHSRDARRSADLPSFLPVQVVGATAVGTQTVHVRLPEGVSIEVPAEQRELLLDLVAQVRSNFVMETASPNHVGHSVDHNIDHKADQLREVAS